MLYTEEQVDQVREASDIVDIVGTYVRLNRRGSNYVGLCPFHNEKTGSFSVNKNMQIYKCFGCGKAGNVFTFLMDYDNLTFVEAVKELADRAGIALPEAELSEEEKEKRNLRDKLFEVNKEAAKYYYGMLRSEQGRHAYKYLSDRAISDDTMKKFGLGYAGVQSDGLYRYLKSKGYSDDILKNSGIFGFSERGAYDKLWGRVVFPYMDKNGKVIAFGGRVMGKADNVPKYLNSPETKIFTKGDNLYGLQIAKHSHKKYMLLCEGYMDTIALHQAGFDNAVGSMGTALTMRQAKLIGNFVNEVVITFDNDEAGSKAILRALPIFKEAGVNAKVINMSAFNDESGKYVAKDPDEFIKTFGAEAYQSCIDNAYTAFEFETQTMRKTIDDKDPAQKTKFDHELARRLSRIEDDIERRNYVEAAARDYNLDFKQLQTLVNKYGLEEYNKAVAQETVERDKLERKALTKPEDGAVKSEQMLVSMIANTPEYYEAAKNCIAGEDFADQLCRKLITLIFNLYRGGEKIVHANIVSKFEEVEDQQKVAGILNSSLYEANISESERKKAFADLTVRVLENSIDRQWQLALDAGNASLLQELMTRKSGLVTLKAGLSL